MSDFAVQPVAESTPEPTPGLSQWQRVVYTFTAPSKTFEDIKAGHKSWWLPFLIVLLTGGILYGTITKQVTWRTVYENQQRSMPAFAKNMMENMPADRRAIADRQGPINQAVTWAISPIGLLIINMISALVLWPTINFGFGGRAKFGSLLAVTMYATLVLWPIKLLIGSIALFAGMAPESFDPKEVAGTNIGYYMEQHSGALYTLARSLDPLDIWCLVLTAIGVAIVAGVKRSSGYIAVFGWWILMVLIGVGVGAAFGG